MNNWLRESFLRINEKFPQPFYKPYSLQERFYNMPDKAKEEEKKIPDEDDEQELEGLTDVEEVEEVDEKEENDTGE